MFKDVMDKIYNRFGTEETMHDVIAITSNVMETIREISPESYKTMMCALEEYLYDIPLNTAQEIVGKMENEYGAHGEKWSYDQICALATQYALPEAIDRVDLYIVMNMWFTDYERTMKHLGLEDNAEAYLMFSCDWLTDCDFGKGKVYKYFVKLHDEIEG